MKRIGILNKDISEVIAGMGHTDMLVICDAGFPIPAEVRRIDLALAANKPRFLDTLRIILKELCVEKVIIAQETKNINPAMYEKMVKFFPNIPVELVPHLEFKERSKKAKAVIRTGEFTSYSNIILVAGVVY